MWKDSSLVHGQELERRRLAREIHDDFCQRIAVMSVQMQTLRALLPKGDAASLDEDLTEALALLGADLQTLSHSLHPS